MSSVRYVIAVLLLLASIAAAARAQEWRLAPSDWARYEQRTVTLKKGKESFGKGTIVSVYGHDLRDEGQFSPVGPKRGDLPAILGFHLAHQGEGEVEVKRRLVLQGVTELRLRGRLEAKNGLLAGRWAFRSGPNPERGDTYRILSGQAHVSARVDGQKGVVSSARVRINYVLKKHDAKAKDKPKRVEAEYDLRLVSLQRRRHGDFQKQVDAAIAKGVKHLRTLQTDDGSYKPHGNWKVGTTALAVLTLAACDVARTDPAIEKALAWMLGEDPKRTYGLAVSLMAFERAYTPPGELAWARRRRLSDLKRDLPPERLAWCRRIAAALEAVASGPGSWGYPPTSRRALVRIDSSNTQYGVLGLRAAARLGLPVKEQTWLGVVRHFEQISEPKGRRGSVSLLREGQALPDGGVPPVEVKEVAGFRYTMRSTRPWGSMTCAGIASLAIARHQLRSMKSPKLTPGFDRRIEQLILGGWAWLAGHWGIDRNPHKTGGGPWHFYYLYSLERAGILDGVKQVDGRDWYFEGAVQLLARQGKKGEWNETGGSDISETCFALLFLKRATAPLSGGR